MPNKKEKEQRKQLLHNLRRRARAEFELSLPMNSTSFAKLFDYLNEELASQACDDTTKLPEAFLDKLGSDNSALVLAWLADKGGHCDCEILANVEETFE